MAETETGQAPVAVIPPPTLATINELAQSIPWVESGAEDAELRIAEQVLAAGSAAELGSPWEARKFEALLDVPVRVVAMRRAESDYQSGPGWYLILDVIELETGEKVTVTTGALAVMVQLVKAQAAGWMPLLCTLRQSLKPSKLGYRPQHLEVQGPVS